MSMKMEDEIKRWTAKRKSALVLDIIQGKTTGLKKDGFDVSIAKLCRWFGVARRTVYYKPVKSAPKVDPKFAEPINESSKRM